MTTPLLIACATVAVFAVLYARARLFPVRVVIRKGNHYPSPYTTLLCAFKVGCFRYARIRVVFGESAANYPEPADYGGAWNKLFGRTHGFLNTPRSGSLRWWWRRGSGDRTFIATAFVYEQDSELGEPVPTATHEPGEGISLRIPGVRGWPCVPYFGGKYPAPAEVRFTLS